MKTLLKWVKTYPVASAFIAVALFLGATQVSIGPGLGLATVKATGTYASAQVDTVILQREGGVQALSFAIESADSQNLGTVIVRRVIDGTASAVIAGDTLTSNDSSATARSVVKTVPLAPLPDTYWVIVTYKTNTGGINQGATTPNYVYQFNKQYSK